MRADIVVLGSLNLDLIVQVPRAPVAGETLAGGGFAKLPGGKGANQAVAAARLGGRVTMIGRVGNDSDGIALRANLTAEGIDVRHVRADEDLPSGVAMIWVEADGQNRIVLVAGANGAMDTNDIEQAGSVIDRARMLIVQLEVPLVAVQAAVFRAHRAGVTVLLNAAPAAPLPVALWTQIDILVVNESEAFTLTGLACHDAASAVHAAQALHARGPECVVITLGAQGAVVLDSHGSRHTSAHAVRAVDTTAAGDTFIGALAVAMCEDQSLDDALALAQAAAALCVTRPGAQASIPHRKELKP